MTLPRFADRVDPSWLDLLEAHSAALWAIDAALRAERESGATIAPDESRILRALEVPVDSVRVIIVGQDPYPTAGHANGLAFSTDPSVRPIPRSLSNIYTELRDDLGIATPDHGDLSRWIDQGVLLLNATLTIRVGDAGSHRGLPWREVTGAVIERLARRGRPLVAVLWGNDAQWAKPILGDTPVVESAHPSPLSARRGFFGSTPFSRVNESLHAQSAEPIEWRV